MHPLFPCHIVTVGEEEVSAEQRIHGTKEYLWNSPKGAYQVLQESFDSQDKYWERIEKDTVIHSIKDHYEYYATRETQIMEYADHVMRREGGRLASIN